MLTQDDINWMRNNRSEVIAGRTESIILVRESQSGTDPYTNEPITSTTEEAASVVWTEYSTVSNTERQVIGGVELRQGDVKVSFEADVVLEDVAIKRGGISYVIVTVDAIGIGATTRQEALVRRAT